MNIDIDELFSGESDNSPGSIGEKIKRIRKLRGLSQKELGLSCGYSNICKYEAGIRTPKEDAIKILAAALEVDECALYKTDLIPYKRLFQALFDIEDYHGLHPVKKSDGIYLEFSGETYLGTTIYKHDYDLFLEKWYEMYQKSLPDVLDTKEEIEEKKKEYTLWRYTYPMCSGKEINKQMNETKEKNRLQAQKQKLQAEIQRLQAKIDDLDTKCSDDIL